jgi:hypothetical protein
LRPKASDNGPQSSTDKPAQKEYPENRNPMSKDDRANWRRIAGRSGLRTWLSATPTNSTIKRKATILISSLVREKTIRLLFEVLDLKMLRGNIGQVHDGSRGHSHGNSNGFADFLGRGAKFFGLFDMSV